VFWDIPTAYPSHNVCVFISDCQPCTNRRHCARWPAQRVMTTRAGRSGMWIPCTPTTMSNNCYTTWTRTRCVAVVCRTPCVRQVIASFGEWPLYLLFVVVLINMCNVFLSEQAMVMSFIGTTHPFACVSTVPHSPLTNVCTHPLALTSCDHKSYCS
jgi:hypothetical protein